MPKSIEVILTSYHNEPLAKAASRIIISKDNLLALTRSLENGRRCLVEKVENGDGSTPIKREAVLWASPEPLKKNLARMSKEFREACGLGPSEKCRITFSAENDEGVVSEAADVVVEDVTNREGLAPLSSEPARIPSWIERLEDQLDAAEVVYPGMVLHDVKRRRVRRSFRVKAVDGRVDNVAKFVVDRTKVGLPSVALPLRTANSSTSTPRKTQTESSIPPPQKLRLGPIEGMDNTVQLLNDFLCYFDPGGEFLVPEQSCAVVLQGDKGTGKTMLLDRLAATGWGGVYPIEPGAKLSAIQETFQKAFEQRPSIIAIDDIQELLSEERTNRAAVVKTLGELLDKHAYPGPDSEGKSMTPQLLVVATCSHYTRDIPGKLRQPGRLDYVVSIPFPDTQARQAIMRSFHMPLPAERCDIMIRELSLKTHAFNAHELKTLYHSAMRRCKTRLQQEAVAADQKYLADKDLEVALRSIKPGRMDGIDIKPLPVYWHQIKGQDGLVKSLQGAVEMLNNPDTYKGYVKTIPRGYLLYGPPGCSKTMAAQALATESGLNYFSVKGGELLNQYVGESERGIRELFDRARLAAPAVIFLDEIDAVAGRRSNFGDKSAGSTRGPQVVPALLSELDGFESLSKVIVVAATNRPEAIDPALLRSGRLERHFYVPPPSEAARRAMLATWTTGMRVSADLNLDHLARLTNDFSGAEIIGICKEVGIRAMQTAHRDGVSVEMTTDMFEERIQNTPRTITPEMLDFFRKWTVSY